MLLKEIAKAWANYCSELNKTANVTLPILNALFNKTNVQLLPLIDEKTKRNNKIRFN